MSKDIAEEADKLIRRTFNFVIQIRRETLKFYFGKCREFEVLVESEQAKTTNKSKLEFLDEIWDNHVEMKADVSGKILDEINSNRATLEAYDELVTSAGVKAAKKTVTGLPLPEDVESFEEGIVKGEEAARKRFSGVFNLYEAELLKGRKEGKL